MSYDIWELRERLEQSEAKNAKLRALLAEARTIAEEAGRFGMVDSIDAALREGK
jgi:hypothetical protein